ncbi:MAG: hypothetical protein KKE39_00880 [Bacteroidetes bacterium]|nr:hypothetical protein [Bacteroidota bacterium]MBU1373294.1 hypothetical protein [Bacteroidota bacterium]MBU1485656.1 hypothetical protein [Bacteroidota bacterium]MBU1761649.1 hypothetical protein [Bacteroidota bacterium]MBU2045632.1 hypothetical protein [Bacteroidota bacterium]
MRFDKSSFKKSSFEEADIQKDFWKTKSYAERLEAGVLMTKIAYGLVNQPEIRMQKDLLEIKSKRG